VNPVNLWDDARNEEASDDLLESTVPDAADMPLENTMPRGEPSPTP
jgi:hypothetical protein